MNVYQALVNMVVYVMMILTIIHVLVAKPGKLLLY